jgi:hypothetical protein
MKRSGTVWDVGRSETFTFQNERITIFIEELIFQKNFDYSPLKLQKGRLKMRLRADDNYQ